MIRINRVYTKTGDNGSTGLIGGDRVSKDHIRIECYGAVDELNASLGLVVTQAQHNNIHKDLIPILLTTQNQLFNIGAELATPDRKRRENMPCVNAKDINDLESHIDHFNENLPDLTSFILPGGGFVSSYLHLSRTICRRTERLTVTLHNKTHEHKTIVEYLNRLSDALFVFGRWASHQENLPEPLWVP